MFLPAPCGAIKLMVLFTTTYIRVAFPFQKEKDGSSMGTPFTFGERKLRKSCPKRGLFGRTGIDPERNFFRALPQMTDPHLSELHAVERTFDLIIRFPSAQPIPHRLDRRVDIRRRPIGITVIGHNAPEPLKRFVFILNGCLQPIFGIQIQRDPALIEPPFALELRFHGKRKEFLFRPELQNGRIVVTKSVIRPLPQIGMRFRQDDDFILLYLELFGRSRPDHVPRIHIFFYIPLFILSIYHISLFITSFCRQKIRAFARTFLYFLQLAYRLSL